MVFSSTVFLFLFFPIVLLIYYCPLLKSRKFKNAFLAITSFVFYLWGEPLFAFLMLFSIIVTWMIGLAMASKAGAIRKQILTAGVIYHIGILFVFKYLSFLSNEVTNLFRLTPSSINIALPIGISFFTFQMMSYLFDVYYKTVSVQKSLLDLALYVSLFPQLIAGPIVRYKTVDEEISYRVETMEDFQLGLKRFVFGLGKKVLIADYLGAIANQIFALSETGTLSMLSAWIGAIAFTLEIYFDFSGYSDMAIGLGLCFGFHFMENFNHPYTALSINDFWKRWHISLTDWFRDYVYIPLGGNRVSALHHVRNIFIVWLLTGIWHGANWTFLVWGLLYCVFQILERYCYDTKRWPVLICRIYTLFVVCINWVIFKSNSLSLAGKYFFSMFGGAPLYDTAGINYLQNSIVTIALGIVACLPIFKRLEAYCDAHGYHAKCILEGGTYAFLVFILLMTVMTSISGGYSPFIYFNF